MLFTEKAQYDSIVAMISVFSTLIFGLYFVHTDHNLLEIMDLDHNPIHHRNIS